MGAAQASIEQAAEHTKVRKQFDSPLADNQVQQTMNLFLVFGMNIIPSVLPIEFIWGFLSTYLRSIDLEQICISYKFFNCKLVKI